MEGLGQGLLSLAGHLKLEKLSIVYDDNHISIDGNTEMSYTVVFPSFLSKTNKRLG
jgi:transketolase